MYMQLRCHKLQLQIAFDVQPRIINGSNFETKIQPYDMYVFVAVYHAGMRNTPKCADPRIECTLQCVQCKDIVQNTSNFHVFSVNFSRIFVYLAAYRDVFCLCDLHGIHTHLRSWRRRGIGRCRTMLQTVYSMTLASRMHYLRSPWAWSSHWWVLLAGKPWILQPLRRWQRLSWSGGSGGRRLVETFFFSSVDPSAVHNAKSINICQRETAGWICVSVEVRMHAPNAPLACPSLCIQGNEKSMHGAHNSEHLTQKQL